MSSPVRLQRPNNLSLDTSKPKSRVTFKEETLSPKTHQTSNAATQKKIRYETDFRAKRKRTSSCSFSWDHINNKRRKAAGAIVLPTKFLLGGNITDPLNLEALDKGNANKGSEDAIGGGYKRGSTVRVIIPPNINDPLNLDACSEDGEEQLADAISRQRRRRKPKKRKRRNSEPGGMNFEPDYDKRLTSSFDNSYTPSKETRFDSLSTQILSSMKDVSATPPPPITTDATHSLRSTSDPTAKSTNVPEVKTSSLPGNADNQSKDSSLVSSNAQVPAPCFPGTPRHPPQKKQRTKSGNKIVSPVIPQPGVERKRHCSRQRHPSADKASNPFQFQLNPPKHFHPKNSRFQFGNYNQYYGYRNMEHKPDPRLKILEKDWFQGKEVLDIGCNIGHVTLSIARDFSPHRIVGIDIDKKLVNIAKKNIKHYYNRMPKAEDDFPSAMKLLYGPLRAPLDQHGRRTFPNNLTFCQSNYVMENDALLETVRPEFDVILCLSVTKWIHLNWGDDGLKRFFKRMFRNLKPGGMIILEPQAWPSYTKKRKLTNEIFENYKNISLFPNQFPEYLTSEIGFIFVQKISISHFSKGFERPIYIFKKADADVAQINENECGALSLKSEVLLKEEVSDVDADPVAPSSGGSVKNKPFTSPSSSLSSSFTESSANRDQESIYDQSTATHNDINAKDAITHSSQPFTYKAMTDSHILSSQSSTNKSTDVPETVSQQNNQVHISKEGNTEHFNTDTPETSSSTQTKNEETKKTESLTLQENNKIESDTSPTPIPIEPSNVR